MGEDDDEAATWRAPSVDHAARRARLAGRLRESGHDAWWQPVGPGLTWLTGFVGSNGGMVLRADDGPHVMATDARYVGAVAPAPDLQVVQTRDLFGVVVDAGARRTAFDPNDATHAQVLGWNQRLATALEAVPGVVRDLRGVKDAAELAFLARACALTVAGWRSVVAEPAARGDLAGMTERRIAVMLERAFVDLGADGVAFDSIVASGPNGAVPHHRPTDRVLRPGELVTVDCGALVGGYHADFTRTVVVSPTRAMPPDDLLAIHDLVVRAQAAGVAAVRVGVPVDQVDAEARAIVVAAGHGQHFPHGVGHGVGLEIHEDPFLGRAGDVAFEPGMVVTVEPGVYVPGLGGVRVEDTIVVTPAGPTTLTCAPVESFPPPD